jgi:hypothetical protein
MNHHIISQQQQQRHHRLQKQIHKQHQQPTVAIVGIGNHADYDRLVQIFIITYHFI